MNSTSQWIKRITLTILVYLFCSSIVSAAPPGYNGGVNNEYEYEEYVFLTGTPIKFSGTLRYNKNENGDTIQEQYNFNLTSPVGSLTRRTTYETTEVERSDKGQTITQTKVTNYNETLNLNIGDNRQRITLKDYQFSSSTVIDNRAAADFYSGNIVGRKVYETPDGEITVSMNGGNVGYQNFWGGTETQVIDYTIKGNSWTGTVRSKASDSKKKYLKYQKNDPSLSSFAGGHVRITEQDMVGIYDYDLPLTGQGTLNVSKKMVPKVERLIVPKFRDLNGHWAQSSIEQLYSLDILEEKSQFFSPNVPMTRYQFTKAIMRAADIRVPDAVAEEPEQNPRRNRRNRGRRTRGAEEEEPKKESIFKDVSLDDPNYNYIESAVNKGIIKGIGPDRFGPEQTLTRAQAITILIRALGFEHRAPSPGYKTSFNDNHLIPNWALDSMYVAQEIELIRGDSNNNANPNQPMTKAEAAALLTRFLDFLKSDLQKDYREDILFMN